MKYLIILFCCLCLILFFAIVVVHVSKAEEMKPKVIKAVKIESEEVPVIDGSLDDPCWEKANLITDFIQNEPIIGAEPKEATKVYVLFDKEKLYVGFECLKEKPDNVFGSQMQRDGRFFQDDYVEVFLDTFHDHRNCYGFAVNCLGTQSDRRIANEGSTSERGPFGDRSRAWDCAWEAKSSKNSKGWIAEMAIPFSELRFNKSGEGTWGINFMRGNEEFEAEDTWSDVGERELSVSKFGVLHGLTPEELVVSRPIELKPYAVVRPTIVSEESDLSTIERFEPDVGVDIRYPTTLLTADFTINPDFAQVEADPTQINIQDTEQRLPEKRPFFQEGMELFQSPMELFYTRRVGIEELDFGAKVVGKLGNYNIALLDCQSNDTLPENTEEIVENPEDETQNNYLVFRTQRDIGTNSGIGIIGINKQKADSFNRVGGIDLNMALSQNLRFMSQYARSSKSDANGDNAYVMSLSGSRSPMGFEVSYLDVGKDFVAESGFIPRIDRWGFNGGIGGEYKWENKIFKELGGHIFLERLENHSGRVTNYRRGFELRSRFSDFFISMEPQWYNWVDDLDESLFYKDRTISFFAGWFPPKWASVRGMAMIGKMNNKDASFIGPTISVAPTEKLRFETEIQRFDMEGDRLQLNRRFTANYQLSHQMFFKTIVEVTRDYRRSIFGIFGWEFQPECNFFVVYTDNKEVINNEKELSRIIFIKVSYIIKWKIF